MIVTALLQNNNSNIYYFEQLPRSILGNFHIEVRTGYIAMHIRLINKIHLCATVSGHLNN